MHTSAPSASNSSITTVRNPLAPLVRTLSIRARTDDVSPSRSGRSKRYSCDPCTTRVKSSAEAGIPDHLREDGELGGGDERGRHALGLTEDLAEGGDARGIHDEGDVGIDGSFRGGVHRAGTLGAPPQRVNAMDLVCADRPVEGAMAVIARG